MGYQPFEKKRVQTSEPTVSITRNGTFTINSGTIEHFFKGNKYAKLYWDVDTKRVGIKPLKKADQYSYSVNYTPRGTGGTFSGTAFFKAVGIDYSTTRTFPATWNDKDGMIEIDVSKLVGGRKERGKE